ncbi:MAG: hypothetical protein K2M55_00760, partial [Muribaculaceae bacterium]|nr:hypothetical protein [Muribaculaceae bacterium]
GMSIRLMQGVPVGDTQVWCNRGVSGIDGSTSTAMGAAAACPDRPLLLVTGDMSAAYDIGALADPSTAGNFNMLVVDNGGGDIFRRIKPTSDLPEREQFLAAMPLFPLAALADAYGFAYVRATAAECTEDMLTDILRNDKKTIIHLITDQYTAS